MVSTSGGKQRALMCACLARSWSATSCSAHLYLLRSQFVQFLLQLLCL